MTRQGKATSRRISLRVLLGMILLGTVVLIAGSITMLIEARKDLVHRADMMASSILVLAKETVQIEISRYDARLADIASDVGNARIDQNALLNPATLFGGPAERSDNGDIIILNGRAEPLASSRPDLTKFYAPGLPELVSGAKFGANGLSVTSAVWGRKRVPEIALIRRVQHSSADDPSFVVGILAVAWIQGVFDSLKLGPGGAIGLIDSTSVLLAHNPLVPDKICTHVQLPPAVMDGPHDCFYTAHLRAPIDGMVRRVTASWVGSLPLIVYVGLAKQDIFGGWNNLVAVIITAMVVLSAGIMALTVLLVRQWRHQMVQDRQLVALNGQLQELARTDQLTGLLNRRGFDENLAREWRRCRRAGRPISLLMLDADNFKQYNDRFGHQAGDVLLRAIADSIVSKIRRPGDIAARYGGEEFSVVLPDTDATAAAEIAESIRAGVEALAIKHRKNGTLVTVSIGMSYGEPSVEGSAEELVGVADGALYESKQRGRNCVTTRKFTPQPSEEQAPP